MPPSFSLVAVPIVAVSPSRENPIGRRNPWGMIAGRPERPVRFDARREREASRC